MRLVMIVLALAACGEVRQHHRWPDHRREKDAQIEMLIRKVEAIEQELARLRQPAAPQPAPAALPSPST